MNSLANKGYWACILGGSSGLGLASARALAKEGLHLLVLHRDRRQRKEELEEHWDELRSFGVKVITLNANALKADAMEAAREAFEAGREPGEAIRLLLHSIAKGNLKPLAGGGPSTGSVAERLDFMLTFEAMAASYYDWIQYLRRHGLFAADARCLAFTSAGSHRSWPHYAQVGAAKGALEAISRSVAMELGPYGIRSNLLQPGIVDTPSLRLIPGHEKLTAEAAARNPFGRLTRPDDVAGVVVMMCRDETAWINGACIPVDGGEQNL